MKTENRNAPPHSKKSEIFEHPPTAPTLIKTGKMNSRARVGRQKICFDELLPGVRFSENFAFFEPGEPSADRRSRPEPFLLCRKSRDITRTPFLLPKKTNDNGREYPPPALEISAFLGHNLPARNQSDSPQHIGTGCRFLSKNFRKMREKGAILVDKIAYLCYNRNMGNGFFSFAVPAYSIQEKRP